MTNKKTTKRALLTSAIALLLCCSMLVGTTYAWFTDEVESVNNVITAGNLDVLVTNAAGDDIQGEKTLFQEVEYWEPGVVAYENLTVENKGTLALSYRMSMAFEALTSVEVEGVVYDLTDVLKVAVYDGEFTGTREDAKKLEFTDTLDSFTLEGELQKKGDSKTVAVVIYWEPGDNAYDNIFNMNNGKGGELKANLGVHVFATQLEYESDSFDNLYDEVADRIIASGEEVFYNGDEVTESLENNGTVNIVGGTVNTDSYALQNNGTANLEDVQVNAGNASNYALIANGPESKMNLDNVDLNAAGGGIGATNGATVNFNSGSIDLNTTSTSGRYLFYAAGEGTKIVINGGDFDFNKTQNQKRAYIYADAGTQVIVNGGNFGKASTRSGYTAGILGDGTVIITGGTFGFDPTEWVAEGYKAVKTDGVWNVLPASGNTVNDAIVNGGVVNVGADVTDLNATIDADTVATINLNGNTATGSIANNGTMTVNGGTLNNDGDLVLNNTGNATVSNVTMEMTNSTGYIARSSTEGSVIVYENVDAISSGGGVNVWDGEAVFKSGSVTTNSTSTSARHVFYVAQGGTLTIEDGTFVFNPSNLTRKGSYLCAQGEGATIIVKGGSFDKPSTRTDPVQALDGGKVIIMGGTFKWDPSAWVAEGYAATETDGVWTVAPVVNG